MNSIRRPRRASSPGRAEPQARQPKGQEPGQAGRLGRDGVAARFIQHVAAGAIVAAGEDKPAPVTANSRRRTMTIARLLPHTIQLCIHCRHNPAGFWVSRTSGQTVRRPWCLSCCQDLDPACHHVQPFEP